MTVEIDKRIVRQGIYRMTKTDAELEQDRIARELHEKWEKENCSHSYRSWGNKDNYWLICTKCGNLGV